MLEWLRLKTEEFNNFLKNEKIEKWSEFNNILENGFYELMAIYQMYLFVSENHFRGVNSVMKLLEENFKNNKEVKINDISDKSAV